MSDEQRPDDAPSLEAPSLGRLFGRRKERTAPAPTPEAEAPAEAPVPRDEPGQPEPAPSAPAPPAADVEDTTVLPPATTVPPARAPRPTLTVSGRVAAVITGLVVGLLVVVLTAGSLALCESVRGVSSCGGGPGFALLVAVTGAMIVLGGLMLRLAKVPDPTSTSFLAVGLLCVIALLFLIESLDQWWMIIVIPIVSMGTFALSHWVTTHVIDTD